MDLSREDKDRIEAEERHRETVRERIREERHEQNLGLNMVSWLFFLCVALYALMQISEWNKNAQQNDKYRRDTQAIVDDALRNGR